MFCCEPILYRVPSRGVSHGITGPSWLESFGHIYYAMNLQIEDLQQRSDFYGVNLGMLGEPFNQAFPPDQRDSFSTARVAAEGGIGWVWCQWLARTPKGEIQKTIKGFVERGMKLQSKAPGRLRYRGLHDLWLLHCGIFACDSKQLKGLAESVVDTSGADGEPLPNDGELYASAWCGMLKHWILGNPKKAAEQSQAIWGAYRYDIARVAAKPLVTKWLAGDWKSFMKAQEKDFETLWERARRDRIVLSEKRDKIVISLRGILPGQRWCWAHCGLALLAYRRGAEVATDFFWFPPYALACTERDL